MIHLAGDHDGRRKGGLIGLGAKPQRVRFLCLADCTDNHLGSSGQDIRTSGNVGGRGLSSQGNIREGTDIVHVYLSVRFGRQSAGLEPIDI